MTKHTLFISDLHLDESLPDITHTFINFLATRARQADALYVLGDMFEAWIGDDDLTPHNQRIIHAVKAYTDSGIPAYFMHGNRDFIVGKRFAKMTGLTFIKDPTRINLYGTPTLLLHGDSLCTLDIKHQKTRRLMHNQLIQRILLTLPYKRRQKIAQNWRERSIARGKTLTQQIMDVTPEEVARVMQLHQVEQMIHGHTHRPAIHQLTVAGVAARRMVLGAWHQGGSVLMVAQDGKCNLVELPFVGEKLNS